MTSDMTQAAGTAQPADSGTGLGQGQASAGGTTVAAAPATGTAVAANAAAPAVTVPEKPPLLPTSSAVIQAGAFGAVLGGISTGVMEMARVKKGEATTEEAVKNVASASAQGAATMAVATVASHMVRARPLFGFLALAAAGLGAFLILNNSHNSTAKPKKRAVTAKAAMDGTAIKQATAKV